MTTTKATAVKATFEGHGLRISIVLDSADQTARLVAVEAARRVAYRFARWATDGEVLASATERASLLETSDGDLRPALKFGVCTIQVK